MIKKGINLDETKVIGAVYETSDYSQFILSERNRNINLKPKQIKDFKKNGIISPVICNEKMMIIDGQHRWEWARKNNVKIKFIIVEGLNEEHIVAMNTTQESWNLLDYTASFANEGKEDYKKTIQNFKKYKLA